MKTQAKFCSIPEAAAKFGVDRKTMYRWVTTGKINSIVTPGGHHRILFSEINNIIESNAFSKFQPVPKKIILIVDDDKSVQKSLKNILTRKSYIVETASDGFQAGLKARDIKPDLIILDLIMDGIDGFEVCRTIKADVQLKNAKILIMTGFDTPEHKNRAIQEGADDYLPKGASFKNLLSLVGDLLSE